MSLPERIYLDHAATTPPTAAARAAVADGLARWANPSSPHAEGRAARAALEEARARIAAAYGWTGEVLLTSGASESLAIALGRSGARRRLVSAVEHDAVLRAAGDAEVVGVSATGLVSPEHVSTSMRSIEAGPERLACQPAEGLDTNGQGTGQPSASPFASSEVEKPPLVAIQWANSETGVRQPIAAVAQAVHAAGALLLVDAAQMPVGADPDVAAYADLIAFSAHKHGGPPGIGALLVRELGVLEPTGGQERGYRPGTENLPGALGWAAALAVLEPLERWAKLRATLDDAITRSGGEVVGAAAPRHPAVGSYRMPGVASAAQLIKLDLAGFAVSAGSACASGSLKPSHVLAAMGWSEARSREVVRVSFGRETTEAEVAAFITAWREIARAARQIAA